MSTVETIPQITSTESKKTLTDDNDAASLNGEDTETPITIKLEDRLKQMKDCAGLPALVAESVATVKCPDKADTADKSCHGNAATSSAVQTSKDKPSSASSDKPSSASNDKPSSASNNKVLASNNKVSSASNDKVSASNNKVSSVSSDKVSASNDKVSASNNKPSSTSKSSSDEDKLVNGSTADDLSESKAEKKAAIDGVKNAKGVNAEEIRGTEGSTKKIDVVSEKRSEGKGEDLTQESDDDDEKKASQTDELGNDAKENGSDVNEKGSDAEEKVRDPDEKASDSEKKEEEEVEDAEKQEVVTPRKRGRPKKSSTIAGIKTKREADNSPKKPIKSKRHYAPSDEELPAGLLELPKTVEDGSKRIRKKTERLETSYESPFKAVEVLLPGSGQKLCDFEHVDAALTDVHPYELKPLHRIVFQRFGSLHEIRRNLRQFNGFAFDAESPQYAKRVQLLQRMTYTQLKRVCDIFKVEKSLSKDDQVDTLISFLRNPQFSDELPRKKTITTPRVKNTSKDISNDGNESSSSKGGRPDKPVTLTPNGHIRKRRRTKAELEIARSTVVTANKVSIEPDYDSGCGEPPKKVSITPTGKVRRRRRTKAEMEQATVDNSSQKSEDATEMQPKNESAPENKPIIKTSKPARSSPKSVTSKTPAKKTSKKVEKILPPSDDDLKEEIKRILYGANLEQITMKTVCRSVYDKFPQFDITPRKDFIKATVKMIIK